MNILRWFYFVIQAHEHEDANKLTRNHTRATSKDTVCVEVAPQINVQLQIGMCN